MQRKKRTRQWLVEQGARHVVLSGRRGEVSGAVKNVLEGMAHKGADVRVIQADVSNRQDVAGLLEKIHRTLPPLRGIIHAAGVLDDGILVQQTWERFQHVMAPKIEGSWNLHEATERDARVCFLLLPRFRAATY